jgi:uncharacterized phage protein (TIGR02218 family)
MKSASPALIALLNSGEFVRADLWTLTLNGGSVIHWSGAEIPLSYGGQTWALGPAIDRGQISEKRGVEVATLDMTITANEDDLINGVPVVQFIARRGFDGANVRLDRAFAPSWQDPVTGIVLRFSGRVTSTPACSGNQAQITISSWAILFNVQMPANLYQAACLHTVYDSGCALDPAAFQSTGAVAASPAASQAGFGSALTGNANRWSQGRVLFTSGANDGISVAVKSNDGSGNFSLVQPLPAAPAAGDTFTAFPGCDLTQGTCQTKFNNLVRFKGTPYVPVPETAL